MGRLRGGMRCIKFLLFTFNFVFWLAGLAVIAFGLWLRFGGVLGDLTSEEKSPEYFYMGLYVLVGAGALMMTVGFFGCCGAVRESQCLLGAFFACLLVIFAAEVTAGVFAFIGKKAVSIQEVQTIYEEAYDDYVMDMGKSNKTLIQFHTAVSNPCELKQCSQWWCPSKIKCQGHNPSVQCQRFLLYFSLSMCFLQHNTTHALPRPSCSL
uniref:Tetraspanin 2 n=1 Tax=Chelydra serpentina TaxID=8475 RepID=A0A8C3RRR2_CHESE